MARLSNARINDRENLKSSPLAEKRNTDFRELKPSFGCENKGSCHKRQKLQAPTPQAPIRNRQTRKVANAKGLNRNTNLT